MKKLLPLFALLLGASSLFAQKAVQAASKIFPETNVATSASDTLYPPSSGDSCATAPTFFTYGGGIISGAADLGNGELVQKVGQLMNPSGDSLVIQSFIALVVHKSPGPNAGSFKISLHDTNDLGNALATSLPVNFDQITDTSDGSISNEFFFASPVSVNKAFYAVMEVENNSDSLFLATTNDDCGNRTAIFETSSGWYYFADEFGVGPNDPLDFALAFRAVADRPVGLNEEPIMAKLKIYPNPATDHLFFEWPSGETGEMEITISDIQGRLLESRVFTPTSSEDKLTIDISKLKPGPYLYRVSGKDHSSHGVFVKE